MKVLNLHIKNIRGIKTIDLEPAGENVVIFGPNGTGKSAVVDALDFLFTGRISRLLGEGTAGITLKKHGRHIDSKPKDTLVEAEIKVPGSDGVFRLKRSLADPDKLEVLSGDESKLTDILNIAARGQHVLSRREILKYIAAKKGERAKEIHALLNLRKIEQLRELFVRTQTEATRSNETAKAQWDGARANVCANLGLDELVNEKALGKINEYRRTLRGKPIRQLDKDKLKEALNPPAEGSKATKIKPDFIKAQIAGCKETLTEEPQKVSESEESLLSEVQKLRSDEALQKEFKSLKLLQYGISLLDDSGKCPLCEALWEPAKLKAKLEQRLLSAQEAKQLQDRIKGYAEFLTSKYSGLKNRLTEIAKSLDVLELPEIKKPFEEAASAIDSHLKGLSYPEGNLGELEQWPSRSPLSSPSRLLGNLHKIEQRVDEEAKKYSPEQKAWDALTELKVTMEGCERAQKEYEKAGRLSARATSLREKYEASRDGVLNKLYKRIETDFVAFYKSLHGEDEEAFEAVLESKGPELNLEVDFYGRGKFPPVALHSEGHQDSMGLCLYLALMKLLTEDKVLLTVLDDVVMSIDAAHRRAFSKLLSSQFSDRQFLITTHNRTWARQLQSDGIVKKKNMVEFRSWNVDTGPIYAMECDTWTQIYDLVKQNRISEAAAKLREFLEFHFDEVCGSLQAKTVHKLDDRFELGDLVPASVHEYKLLLKKGKSSAKRWERKEDVDKLSEIETITNDVVKRSQLEQWGINPNVHYSRWADFSRHDFLPVAEAFQDLCQLFKCSKCGGPLFVASTNKEKKSLRCACAEVNWNLVRKAGTAEPSPSRS